MKLNTEGKISGALRLAIVVVSIALQLLFIVWMVRELRNNAVYVYIFIEITAVVNIFALASRNKDSAYTIAWMLVIMCLPVFGHLLYLLWGRSDTRGRRQSRTRASIAYGRQFLPMEEEVFERHAAEHPTRKRLASYLAHHGFPLYRNTDCRYFPLGELQFDAMIEDLGQAKRFIFMQYFTVDTGRLWNRVRDLLVRKAEEGVEVRLMFDDLGSVTTMPEAAVRKLREHGVRVVPYAPVHRFINRLYINYRNHQKITVIDGTVGYTGGVNLADEYANYIVKHGHWKDTAVRLEGDAVRSLTVTFLEMWDSEFPPGKESDYAAYCRPAPRPDGAGYFQPFADGPVNNPDNPAEVMYRNLISGAQEYCYISTPYLVINNTVRDLLCAAAAAGVDVRIVTPGIYDHWFVHTVSRSNYRALLEGGARIYEYTPGYIHAKTILADGDHCVTGSINMDYRSFNLHYENGVWICGAPVLEEIRLDFDALFPVCEEIFLERWLRRPAFQKLAEGVLRVFAVML